jgi:outer membrane lipopolysaccharide assembly protein LptE/RlpB
MKNIIFILSILLLSGCGYKFNGASIPAEMKTISVAYIVNNAQLVYPQLSQELTEGLKERIRTQSRLNIVPTGGDASFEGKITGYDIKPISIQDNAKPTAGANRLTITMTVKYTSTKDKAQSFDQSFSAFTDFSLAGKTLQSQEKELVKKVTVQLTENIFNRAFAQW